MMTTTLSPVSSLLLCGILLCCILAVDGFNPINPLASRLAGTKRGDSLLQQQRSSSSSGSSQDDNEDCNSILASTDEISRRGLFQATTNTASALALGTLAATSSLLTTAPRPANAADASTAITANDIFLRLKSIPTFCLVNEDGIPYMIFDGAASATGYFFLSFDVAFAALEDARTKDTNRGATEVWNKSSIIVVPLTIALQLSLRKTQREAINNGIKFNTFNDVVASAEGVSDAQTVDTKSNNPDKWVQKGRVPLFYIDGLTLLSDGREPRYFNKLDAIQEWKRQHPEGGVVAPPVKVVEMIDLYRNALARNDFTKLANLVIVPVAETNAVAKKLVQSAEKPLPKYDFNKVCLVGTAT